MSGATRKRVAILISGRGSNMKALIQAAIDPNYPGEIALVISNREGAAGLGIAEEHGIATRVIPHRQFKDRAEHDARIHKSLEAERIDLVCLAGYMRLLTADFVNRWQGRMINIHPSLLPAFRGVDIHARVLAAGCRIHGATVHFVTPEMDEGPIIAQAAIPVLATDTEESLAERVLAVEHRLYPLALRLVAEGAARMSGGATVITSEGATDPEQLILSVG